jgi:hypothetical protein
MANPQRPQIPPGVLEALKQGNKIEAIRLLREGTKMGLAESKAMVEMLDKMKGVAGTAQAIANVLQGKASAAAARPAASQPVAPVRMHAHPQANLPLRRPGLSPGEVPRESSGAWGIVALVAIGLALAYGFVR